MSGLFYWYWFPIYIIFLRHIFWMIYTIYFHRDITHRSMRVLSHKFEKFCRIILWLGLSWWPGWKTEAWFAHNFHHQFGDTDIDSNSPRRFTFKQITHINRIPEEGDAWFVPQEWKNAHPNPYQDFDDHLENFFKENRYLGIWLVGIVGWILFGPLAGFLSGVLWYLLEKYWHPWVVVFMFHGIGTCKAIDYTSPNHGFGYLDTKHAVNYFPIGILHCGEEFHSNHTTRPGGGSFSHRWWEIDLGYLYAKIFEKFGLLEIKRKH